MVAATMSALRRSLLVGLVCIRGRNKVEWAVSHRLLYLLTVTPYRFDSCHHLRNLWFAVFHLLPPFRVWLNASSGYSSAS